MERIQSVMRQVTRDLVDGFIIGEDPIADDLSVFPLIGGGDRVMYGNNADCGVFDFLFQGCCGHSF